MKIKMPNSKTEINASQFPAQLNCAACGTGRLLKNHKNMQTTKRISTIILESSETKTALNFRAVL
jgi:hypothetical protein